MSREDDLKSPKQLSDSGLLSNELNCLAWEAQMADLAEGLLTPEEEAELREHAAKCPLCGQLLENVGRGRAWVRLLHEAPPEMPEALFERILAQTSQAAPPPTQAAAPGIGEMPVMAAMPSGPVIALHGQREARILMTAAMAIFSIALTLSLTAQRLGNLRPSSVAATASHHFFDTKKQVVAFYDNLRLVREIEATMQDMRRTPEEGGKKNAHPQSSGPSALQRTAPGSTLLARGAAAEERTTL